MKGRNSFLDLVFELKYHKNTDVLSWNTVKINESDVDFGGNFNCSCSVFAKNINNDNVLDDKGWKKVYCYKFVIEVNGGLNSELKKLEEGFDLLNPSNLSKLKVSLENGYILIGDEGLCYHNYLRFVYEKV